MAKTRSWNPIAFVPAQVTVLASLTYVALLTALLWVHLSLPVAPSNPTPQPGMNLTQAWLDLDFISDGYHPLDSQRNEVVREYLLSRIEQILVTNGADYKIVNHSAVDATKSKTQPARVVTVFNDLYSNVTFVDDWRNSSWTCSLEGTNILVYVRGTEDPVNDWWDGQDKYDGQGGVLVNAHYDSVQSGYGATDDGVGVVSILQLISHFTTEGHRPKRGLVALLNNGEELGLYGAKAYLRHPISQLPHVFLNLEGAGAGGRATLFRSTDAEVTSFYANSPYPFGTVVSGDGFKRGFIKSGTDYSVFTDDLGMRGVDVAFFEPRARYHTNQDDSRHTSKQSLWHMLSSAIATTKAMTSYAGEEFEGDQSRVGRLLLDQGSDGVWFDMFGRAFAVFTLNTLFALSVTFLVVGPVILIATQAVIAKSGRFYPFSRKQYVASPDDDEPVLLGGLRGFLRFPIAFVFSTAVVASLAFLQAKINPFAIYSSEWTVWAMMLCAWFVAAWFVLAGADRVRPTALHRLHVLIWIYAISWLLLVLATVGAHDLQIAGGYFAVVYNASVFLALLISYLDLLRLPTKAAYARHIAIGTSRGMDDDSSTRRGSQSSRTRTLLSRGREEDRDDDATERTSLLRGGDRRSQHTFTGHGRRRPRSKDTDSDERRDVFARDPYGDEQAWSGSLTTSTWLLQFLVLVPINVILVGQIALLVTTSMNQTSVDGSPVLPVYLLLAGLSVLLLVPLTPFLHRFAYQVPAVLFIAFSACLVYNLLAFPFSADARCKVYFLQQIELNSGANNVTLHGLDGYVEDVISQMPSSAGQTIHCGANSSAPGRSGLQSCSWQGLSPNVVAADPGRMAVVKPYKNRTGSSSHYKDWVSYNVAVTNQSATFRIQGQQSKQCRIVFHEPASEIEVKNAAKDARLDPVPRGGSQQVTLISRTWGKTFEVSVRWEDGPKNKTGRVLCLWNDANQPGVIPAYDEAVRFAPVWSAVTKASDGLVEGFKTWTT